MVQYKLKQITTNMKIQIKPQVVSYTLDNVSIWNTSVVLGETASFSVAVSSETKEGEYARTIWLTKEEYDAWGNDDNYIVDLVLSKLDLEKA